MKNFEKPLHIHKRQSFSSVIFEDAAIREGDIIHHPRMGKGHITRRFVAGIPGHFCAHFDSVGGEQMLRTMSIELEEDGTFSHHGIWYGENKRIRHDKEIRDLMYGKK